MQGRETGRKIKVDRKQEEREKEIGKEKGERREVEKAPVIEEKEK
jgi:hypothetical protein